MSSQGRHSGAYGIAAIVFAALFALLLWLVVTGRTQALDDRLLAFFYGMREDSLTDIVRAITFCGNSLTMVGLCVLIIILPGRLKVGLPVSLMVVVGFFAQTLLKELVARPRPDPAGWLVEESTYSFPSGHANASMIFWVALLILVGRVLILQDNRFAAVLLRIVFAIFAVLVGLSRPYLGVHYPSDVLGGWLLAALILVVCFALYDNFWPYKWRVTYDMPAWGAMPRGAEKKRAWRKPSKKRAPGELIKFPKKRKPWKMPPE